MTNIILWAIAGGVAGWIGYAFLDWNGERGLKVSILIGMLGGFVGGKVVAPLIGAANTVDLGDFSPLALCIALASAAAILIVSSMIHKRYGF